MSEVNAPDSKPNDGSVCCVCGQTEATLWRKSGDQILGGPDIYTDVKCTTCGTVRLFPRPSTETMNRAYGPQTYARAEENDNGSDGESGLAARLNLFFDKQAGRAEAALAVSPAAPRRLLDVGCGDGRFLQAMQKRGWETVGLETDLVAANLARHRTGSVIHETPLETADLPEGAFGMVSLLHVLEHVPDPRQTISEAFRLLVPGGVLLLALPNAHSWEAKLFGANWYPLDLPRHYWGFGPRTLSRLVTEMGFVSPDLRYLPFFFGPQSLRYTLRAWRNRPVPPPLSGKAMPAKPEGGAKTTGFAAWLAASETMGRVLPGEVMELTALRPRLPETKTDADLVK